MTLVEKPVEDQKSYGSVMWASLVEMLMSFVVWFKTTRLYIKLFHPAAILLRSWILSPILTAVKAVAAWIGETRVYRYIVRPVVGLLYGYLIRPIVSFFYGWVLKPIAVRCYRFTKWVVMDDTRFEVAMLIGLATFVGGAQIDLSAHRTGRVSDAEGFLTPFHAIMYFGGAQVVYWLLAAALIRKGNTLKEALPPGYYTAFLSIPLFFFGGAFDFWWHELWGVEQKSEGIVSLSHLVLMIAFYGFISSPFQAMCLRRAAGERLTWWRDWIGMSSLFMMALFSNMMVYYGCSALYVFRMLNPQQAYHFGIEFKEQTIAYIRQHDEYAFKMWSILGALSSIWISTFFQLFLLLRVGMRYRLPWNTWPVMFFAAAINGFLYEQTNPGHVPWVWVSVLTGVLVQAALKVIDYHRSEFRVWVAIITVPFLFNGGLILASFFLTENWWTPHVNIGVPFFGSGVAVLLAIMAYRSPKWLAPATRFLPEKPAA